MRDISLHPCFNESVRHTYGRVHLPVAPRCNIQCSYCDRKYDCCNESRPGVTSTILSPVQSVEYLSALTSRMPNISVIGIAGPGDPFANVEETLETLRLVSLRFPSAVLCLSTNGLDLSPHISRLSELGVTHMTLTINSLRPPTLARMYRWVRYNRRVYRGEEGGKVLLEQQLSCIPLLKSAGITVKVNTVICPEVNMDEAVELAERVSGLGADTMNCIPLYPVASTDFGGLRGPTKEEMRAIKSAIATYIHPMPHCARCRADAAGLLGHDDTEAMSLIGHYASLPSAADASRTRVAVASNEGLLVNQHLGEARKLYIFERSRQGYHFVEMRATPPVGGGVERWRALVNGALHDCRAILLSGIGESPLKVLESSGIRVIEMSGLIDAGLDAVYGDLPIKTIPRSASVRCNESCGGGNGAGCG